MKSIWIKLPILLAFLFFFQIKANSQTLTLVPSNYHGYNVSCFGSATGSINLTISGGTPPYTIVWSNAATTEDISNLTAGYYRVSVDDADPMSGPKEAEITLTEPRQLGFDFVSPKYPNDFNISIFGACNGSISTSVADGVSPYTYLWNDNSTSQNRNSLCAATYEVVVTDLNGCTKKIKNIVLTQPDRSDWQMSGNSNVNSSSQFIGTIDNNDLMFKTNNVNRLKISSNGIFNFNGQLKIDTPSTDPFRSVFVDQDGIIRTYGPGNGGPPYAPVPDWSTKGNNINNSQDQYIGTNNQADLVFKTTNLAGTSERMRINQNGNITINNSLGIGVSTIPQGYSLVVDQGKVGFREVFVKLSGAWPDYVFSGNYKLKPLNELQDYFLTNKHLPGMPKALEIEKEGQNIGEIQRLQQEKIEEVFLYIIKHYCPTKLV